MVNVSAKESGGYVRRWNGQLTPMAEKLLEEYASLNDIDELYIACMWVQELISYYMYCIYCIAGTWASIKFGEPAIRIHWQILNLAIVSAST